MYKKIFSTTILNVLTAAVNFLSSYLIVKTLSLDVFGEFAIFSSYLAFGGLIYAVIPSNFSIFKLQDEQEYKVKLLVFFMLSSILFLFFVFFMSGLGFITIDVLTIYLFGISTFLLGYFDIKFQASGRLNRYFSMLFMIALLKICTLGLFYYMNHLNSLSDLLWTMTIVQLAVIFFYAFEDRKEIKFILKNRKVFSETLFFIKSNFTVFKPYYLNTFLKKLRENVIILVFSKFNPVSVIGLFSIFVKITSFVLGLSRTLEAFFMNRENIKNYKETFYQKIIYFTIFIQLLFLIVGSFYLKLFSGEFYFFQIFILSFLAYPHIYFLLARSEMLSNYNNREVNFSELIFILIILLGAIVGFFFDLKSLHSILFSFIFANFGLQFYMIYRRKVIYD